MTDQTDKNNNKTKVELQHELEAKREEIAETVDKIRTTVKSEVKGRREAIRQATDWKYYVKKKPVACVGGAMAVGFFVGKMAGDRLFEDSEKRELDGWRERVDDFAHTAERKVDEWRGRAQGESKWKARSRSAFNSGTNLLFRELAKTAQHMILPTVIAAITGKMSSDNKTTVVEKEVHRDGMGPDVEVTKNVKEYEDGELEKDNGRDV